ncbi:unnamed protein product [Miscanthus lutarioriparius]|uniref:Uncharacterized protein n=1 Tax=Miscanthus lutarioriparius TaxID=422564 RepID=A0A811S782_9POAL|nr:unnamed protein product [Miscanthus lutarioriparius]
MVLSPALSLWYSPSPALAVAPLWYSLPLEPLPFALTVFLEFRFRSLPMSRGTRIGDVYCVGSGPEEEDDHDCLPIKFSFSEGFSTGSGRILSLNNRLLKFYGDIGFYHNEELAAIIASEKKHHFARQARLAVD